MYQSLYFLNMCNTELLHHGVVLLLQRSGVDDTAEQAAVAQCVLLSFVPLIQQMVVQEQQLTAQKRQLIRGP